MEEGVTVGRVHGASRLRDNSPEEQSLERARALVLLRRGEGSWWRLSPARAWRWAAA